jgi:hypothetical protein
LALQIGSIRQQRDELLGQIAALAVILLDLLREVPREDEAGIMAMVFVEIADVTLVFERELRWVDERLKAASTSRNYGGMKRIVLAIFLAWAFSRENGGNGLGPESYRAIGRNIFLTKIGAFHEDSRPDGPKCRPHADGRRRFLAAAKLSP